MQLLYGLCKSHGKGKMNMNLTKKMQTRQTQKEQNVMKKDFTKKNLTKKNLSKFLLTSVLTLGTGFTAMGGQVYGNVDEIQGNTISGWVYDTEEPDSPVTAAVFVADSQGNIIQKTITVADKQREDVAAKGYGSACGFSLTMDWSSLPDGAYTVHVVAGNQTIGGKHQYYKGGQRLHSLGTFKTTGYCPCRSCSSGWGARTSSGAIAQANHTIAVDPRIIPYGTKVMINGVVYTAEDMGSGVKGKHIDIFYNTHGEARLQGVQYAEVFLLN